MPEEKNTNMQWVNLTPHTINEVSTGFVVPPSGTIARVESVSQPMGSLGGIPICTTEFGDIAGLPEPQEQKIFIVSGMVLAAIRATGHARSDVVAPGELVRDSDGRPCGCRGFRK